MSETQKLGDLHLRLLSAADLGRKPVEALGRALRIEWINEENGEISRAFCTVSSICFSNKRDGSDLRLEITLNGPARSCLVLKLTAYNTYAWEIQTLGETRHKGVHVSAL